jgi:hypothetical protein
MQPRPPSRRADDIGKPGQYRQFASYYQQLAQNIRGRAANAVGVAQVIKPDYMSVLTEPDTEEEVSGQTNLNNVTGVSEVVQSILTALQGS